jgi:hypothetical protein
VLLSNTNWAEPLHMQRKNILNIHKSEHYIMYSCLIIVPVSLYLELYCIIWYCLFAAAENTILLC